MDLLSFALLGIGTGAIYAAFGLGLVLMYRSSGVINFGYGATVLFGVYQFADLTKTGELVFPIGSLQLGEPIGTWPAMAIVLVHAAVLTLAVYALAFRPLHKAPPLAKVVVSVGVMLAVQALILVRFGSDPRSIAPILPNDAVNVAGATMPRDRLYLAGIVVLLAALLHAFLTYTRTGIASRGASQNEKGAVLLGLRPTRLAAVNWTIAGVGGTALGVLIAPTTSLEAGTYTLLIVPALGAALIGRLSSISAVVAGGIALGVVQSGLMQATLQYKWLPQNGLKQGLPFLVIIAVLVLYGKGLPGRGALEEKLPPAASGPLRPWLIVPLVALAAVAMQVFSPTWRLGLITSLAAVVVCLSLVVLTGFVGQISLAQMSLAGVAGFALSKFGDSWGIPFPIAPLLAALAATVVGVLVSIPATRVRGLHLAVVTIAAAVAIEEFIFKNPNFTGGLTGSPVPQPELFGISLGIRGGPTEFPRPAFGYFVLAVAVAAAIGVAMLRRSDLGRQMLAVRSSERAAAAAGLNTARVKLIGATISSFLAGVGGTLMGYQQGQLSFETFSVFTSLLLLAVVYIGGVSSVSGGLVAGMMFSGGLMSTAIDQWFGLGDYETLILALALVLGAVANPEGVAGMAARTKAHFRKASSPRPKAPVPEREERMFVTDGA
ncbi:ABC transporter permease [Actinomadura geliboluensis]|uniref:ABC transporter permease n=1 Tax=Actinomadura geliboluensis TaxID=882440 RepID=UPI0037185FE5